MGAESAEARIRERLTREGRLTFADFMAEALYGPAGYYTTRPRLGGAGADFFTSPELHPAFGALLGRFAAHVWASLGRPDRFDLVEYGPGSGALCRDVLTWAEGDHPAFSAAIRYRLAETSPALRDIQRETLARTGLLDERVSWEDSASSPEAVGGGTRPSPCPLPGGEGEPSPPGRGQGEGSPPAAADAVVGLILANELVDAFPVHLVAVRAGRLVERYVVFDDDRLGWREDEASTPVLDAYFDRLGLRPGEGCVAEVNLAGVEWVERTAASLARGALVLLDYGYPAAELYAPTRRVGTLLTYRAHTLGSDPLVHVGEQDLTAHVDFTSLARAGERSGLATVGLIDQATLLGHLGLHHYVHLLDVSRLPPTEHGPNRRALLALADLNGLGRVQALLQTHGLDGFAPLDTGDVPAPTWLPILRPGQMRLIGPLDAEGPIDVDEQWRELFAAADDDDDEEEEEARPS